MELEPGRDPVLDKWMAPNDAAPGEFDVMCVVPT